MALQYRARKLRIESNRANSLAERLEFRAKSEEAMRRCLALDPSDGRGYVVLGKLLTQQRRFEEARKLYEEGTTATGEDLWLGFRAWKVQLRVVTLFAIIRKFSFNPEKGPRLASGVLFTK